MNVTFRIAKSYIFSCRMSESRSSINAFRLSFLTEKYYAKKMSSIHKFKTIWSDFIILLEENLNTTQFNCAWIRTNRCLCSSVSFMFIVKKNCVLLFWGTCVCPNYFVQKESYTSLFLILSKKEVYVFISIKIVDVPQNVYFDLFNHKGSLLINCITRKNIVLFFFVIYLPC